MLLFAKLDAPRLRFLRKNGFGIFMSVPSCCKFDRQQSSQRCMNLCTSSQIENVSAGAEMQQEFLGG
jgi:hypothetical protein